MLDDRSEVPWQPMRAPVAEIFAPSFPLGASWINVAGLRMDKQLGRPVLVEFWDFCRASSVRTLPYVRAWHERYGPDGLRVVGVHCPGFPPSHELDSVRAAAERLGVEYAVCVDGEFALWREYGNRGWPARYLWDQEGKLHHFHYGEGAYEETERAIGELLGVTREPLAPLRPEDAPGVVVAAPTPDQPGAYSGPYEAGAVWAVLDGRGELRVNGRARQIEYAGCHLLIEHDRHVAAELRLALGTGLTCHAVCFTAGRAPAG